MKNEDGGGVVKINTSLEMLQEWERDRALKGKKKEAQLARSLDPAFKMVVMMVLITHNPESLVYNSIYNRYFEVIELSCTCIITHSPQCIIQRKRSSLHLIRAHCTPYMKRHLESKVELQNRFKNDFDSLSLSFCKSCALMWPDFWNLASLESIETVSGETRRHSQNCTLAF